MRWWKEEASLVGFFGWWAYGSLTFYGFSFRRRAKIRIVQPAFETWPLPRPVATRSISHFVQKAKRWLICGHVHPLLLLFHSLRFAFPSVSFAGLACSSHVRGRNEKAIFAIHKRESSRRDERVGEEKERSLPLMLPFTSKTAQRNENGKWLSDSH